MIDFDHSTLLYDEEQRPEVQHDMELELRCRIVRSIDTFVLIVVLIEQLF